MGTTCSCNDNIPDDSMANVDQNQNQNIIIQAKLGKSKLFY